MRLSWQISQETLLYKKYSALGDGINKTILVSKFGCSHFIWGLSHPKLGLKEETLTCVSV